MRFLSRAKLNLPKNITSFVRSTLCCSVVAVTCFICLTRCVDFSIYSDGNEVKAVRAAVTTTDAVVIDKEEIISGDEGRIILSVKGKIEEGLPLTVRMEFDLSKEAKILYQEKYRELTFRTLQDSIRFQVIAQSGLPKKWTVKLTDVRSGAGNIVFFGVDSYTAGMEQPGLVADTGRIYTPNLVEVFVNARSEAVFPLEIVPDMRLSEFGEFIEYTPGTPLRFENAQSVCDLKVRAENKSVQDWRVVIRTPESDDVNLKGGSFVAFTDCVELSDTIFTVDTLEANAAVRLDKINDWKNFNVMLQYRLRLPVGAHWEFMDGETEDFTTEKVIFNGIEDIRRFKIVSQSGKEKIWKLKLDYRFDRVARVTNFSVDSWTPEELVKVSVNPSTSVDTVHRRVYVQVEEGVKAITDKTPLEVYPLVQLSEKSSMRGLEAGQKNVYRLPAAVFKRMADTVEFTIYSESGEPSKWAIALVDKQSEKDAQAEVEHVLVHTDKLPTGVAFTSNLYVPETGSREVVMKLERATFPFLLTADAYTVKTSGKARLMEGQKALVFENVGDRKTLRVEAENGGEKVWTLRLDYTQNSGADIKTFAVQRIFPTGIAFERAGTVDAETGRVTIHVTDAEGLFPVRMDVVVGLSENARLQEALASVVFTSEGQVQRVHVESETGVVREWTIGLENRVVKSDQAVIESFAAVAVDPAVQLGNVELTGRNASVELLTGRHSFPISLDISGSTYSEGATPDKTLLTFANVSRKELVKVTSHNGKVTNGYVVSLKDLIPPSDTANILSFRIGRYSPMDYRLNASVELDSLAGQVRIGVYGGVGAQPLVVWPEIQLSEGASLQTRLPDNGLEFSSATTTHEIRVVAEDGNTVRTWQVGVKALPVPQNGAAAVTQVEATNSDNIVIEPVVKDNYEVALYMGNAQPLYPFTVHAALSVSPNATVRVVGRAAAARLRKLQTRAGVTTVYDVDLVFQGASDKIAVEVTSEDGAVKNTYTFHLDGTKVKNTEANVLEYKIESYVPLSMAEAPLVFGPDAEQGLITVNAPDESAFPFTILTTMRLSYGATLVGDFDASQQTFERGTTSKSFDVVAESGDVKHWQLQVKVAEKSKEKEVTAFEVADYTPQAAGLGRPDIQVAQRRIVIPVSDWQKGSRLQVNVGRVELSPKATTDLRTSLLFTSPKDEVTFNVTAQDGSVAEWRIQLSYTYSTLADITSFRVTAGEPANITYNPTAVIDASARMIYIDVIDNLTFPFTVTTDIAYSPKTEVAAGGLSDGKIRFDTYQDETAIRVTAEDGVTAKEWKVRLRYHFSDEADITAFRVAASSPSAVVLGSPATTLDAATHTVWLNVAAWGGQTSVQITPEVDLSPRATCRVPANMIFVKKSSETGTLRVVAESGREEVWTVKLAYEESSGAEITKVTYTGYAPSDITFRGVTMDAKRGEVTLELQTWNGHSEFTLQGISCTLSANATASIPAEMTFRKLIQESMKFTVTAQDGTTKDWTFRLIYNESSAAEVTRFRITGNNKAGIISMATTGVIGDGTIDIDLNSGVRDAFATGFQIEVAVDVSPKASSNFPSSILFSKPSDQRKYTVTAESGATKDWTVRFVNKASQEASLLAFRGVSIVGASTTNTKDFGFTELALNGTALSATITDVMTLNKYDRNWPRLDLALDVQLSPQAKVKEGTTVSVNVANAERKTLTVVADDGVHQQTYTFDASYQPQLVNRSLDSWSDNNTPSGDVWGTANNSFVKGTSRTTGKSGMGANLLTSEAVGMKAAGSIFLGTFKFTSLDDALNNPRNMTYFGIAFPVRPKGVKVDIQYKQGNGTLKDGSKDKGHIWMELQNWPDPTNPKNSANKRYAYGEYKPDHNISSWETVTVMLKVEDASVVPTHLLFVVGSSHRGDLFDAVVGTEMKVDNVELIY